MGKKISDEQKRTLVIKALKKLGKASSRQVSDETGLSREECTAIAKQLISEKKARVTGVNGKFLELIAKKEEAPAKAKSGSSKTKAKAKVEDDDDDEDWDDDEDEDEDDEEGSEDEDDEDEDDDEDSDDDDEEGSEDEDEDDDSDDDDEDEDEDDDDEEEEPAPKKKGKKGHKVKAKASSAKGSDKKAKVKAPKEFTMNFKTIDTLTDKELSKRIDMGLEAAEQLVADKYPEVAELIMRSVVRCRKQLDKRKG